MEEAYLRRRDALYLGRVPHVEDRTRPGRGVHVVARGGTSVAGTIMPVAGAGVLGHGWIRIHRPRRGLLARAVGLAGHGRSRLRTLLDPAGDFRD